LSSALRALGVQSNQARQGAIQNWAAESPYNVAAPISGESSRAFARMLSSFWEQGTDASRRDALVDHCAQLVMPRWIESAQRPSNPNCRIHYDIAPG
jgi:hypothetical protein